MKKNVNVFIIIISIVLFLCSCSTVESGSNEAEDPWAKSKPWELGHRYNLYLDSADSLLYEIRIDKEGYYSNGLTKGYLFVRDAEIGTNDKIDDLLYKDFIEINKTTYFLLSDDNIVYKWMDGKREIVYTGKDIASLLLRDADNSLFFIDEQSLLCCDCETCTATVVEKSFITNTILEAQLWLVPDYLKQIGCTEKLVNNKYVSYIYNLQTHEKVLAEQKGGLYDSAIMPWNEGHKYYMYLDSTIHSDKTLNGSKAGKALFVKDLETFCCKRVNDIYYTDLIECNRYGKTIYFAIDEGYSVYVWEGGQETILYCGQYYVYSLAFRRSDNKLFFLDGRKLVECNLSTNEINVLNPQFVSENAAEEIKIFVEEDNYDEIIWNNGKTNYIYNIETRVSKEK